MKKITAFLLAAIIAIGTAACGKSETEAEPEQPSATVTAAQTELTTAETTMQAITEATTQATTAETQREDTINVEECLRAYKTFLQNYLKNNSVENEANFALIYIDDDIIPELAVAPAHYHAAGAALYIYDGKSVKEIGNFGEFGQFIYAPKKNVFVSSYMGFGVSSGSAFKLKNGEAEEIFSFKEEPIELGSEEYRYYINDKEVPYAQYQTYYSSNIPEETMWAPENSEPNTFYLNEDGIVRCFG